MAEPQPAKSELIIAAEAVAEALRWHVFVARDGGQPTESALVESEELLARFEAALRAPPHRPVARSDRREDMEMVAAQWNVERRRPGFYWEVAEDISSRWRWTVVPVKEQP